MQNKASFFRQLDGSSSGLVGLVGIWAKNHNGKEGASNVAWLLVADRLVGAFTNIVTQYQLVGLQRMVWIPEITLCCWDSCVCNTAVMMSTLAWDEKIWQQSKWPLDTTKVCGIQSIKTSWNLKQVGYNSRKTLLYYMHYNQSEETITVWYYHVDKD